jgi:hypothetical protein
MNAMTEGKPRDLGPDGQGATVQGPSSALADLQSEVRAAAALKEGGQTEAARQRSSIESRTDLRIAATNEAMRLEPGRAANLLQVERDTAQRWADLDASDFGRIRSTQRRESALEAIAGHTRASPEYAQELKKRSPVIAESVRILNEERGKAEQALQQQEAEQQRKAQLNAGTQAREAVLDSAALAALATARARESARVREQLAGSVGAAVEQAREAVEALKAPPLGGRVTASNDPDIAAQRLRAIKRPVTELELGETLLERYIVSREKRGLLDQGATEFTVRVGESQGQLAFVDVGKTLSTQREDKNTIRSMVEVATAKHWQEVTVSGTDEFRRNAWLEANLQGIEVRGYEPREADKILLAQLRQSDRTVNSITVLERDKTFAPEQRGRTDVAAVREQIDGDALTPHEKTVLANSRAILDAKAVGKPFTDATLAELENKLRGERAYVGEVIEHGAAPYKFNRDNEQSYFVTLRTRTGDQVIWGKGLGEAMSERAVGDQIVLQNIGRKDVTVPEKVRDAQGQLVQVRPKDAHLNQWKVELLSRYTQLARTEIERKTAPRNPAFGVYDPKSPRSTALTTPAPAREPQRSVEAQRGERDR